MKPQPPRNGPQEARGCPIGEEVGEDGPMYGVKRHAPSVANHLVKRYIGEGTRSRNFEDHCKERGGRPPRAASETPTVTFF